MKILLSDSLKHVVAGCGSCPQSHPKKMPAMECSKDDGLMDDILKYGLDDEMEILVSK